MTQELKTIDPQNVPQVTLRTEDKMPIVGLGTFGSDRYSNDEIANAIKIAIRMGYRHIDCAEVYQNEKGLEKLLLREL